jgi:hypothetical protein
MLLNIGYHILNVIRIKYENKHEIMLKLWYHSKIDEAQMSFAIQQGAADEQKN